EEIRLLANIETDDEKLLPVVLVGQPELGAQLNRPELRQLKQRVALRCSLRTLRLRETAAYIAGRIGVAGGDAATLFTAGAVQAIYRYSGGVPRTISVICDNALVTGFAADERPVDVAIVEEVCRDLDLTVAPADGRRTSSNTAPAHEGGQVEPGQPAIIPPWDIERDSPAPLPVDPPKREPLAVGRRVPVRFGERDPNADRSLPFPPPRSGDKLVVSPAVTSVVREQYNKLAAAIH